MIDVENVIRTIKTAFAGMPYPSGGRITPNNTHDYLMVEKDFANKQWEDISLEFMPKHYDALCFMTDEAYRYYLPAFMIQILYNYEEADMAVITVISSLKWPAKEDKDEIKRTFEENQYLLPVPFRKFF
jgi:hypothetical protein